MTFLSLSSTVGQLGAKLVGCSLASFMSWRSIARIGAFVAIIGAFVLYYVVPNEAKPKPTSTLSLLPNKKGAKHPISSVWETVRAVVGSKVFWMVGFGHVAAYLGRTCDRILGPFLRDMTALPRELLLYLIKFKLL